MNPESSGINSLRRRRRSSWKYDEDHHIRQYSAENELLPIHEYKSEDGLYHENAHEYDCNEFDEYNDSDGDGEANHEDGLEFCEYEDDYEGYSEESNHQNAKQPPQPDPRTTATNSLPFNTHVSGRRRRRRPLRKSLGKGWEIPSPAVMQRRNRFRQMVLDETRRHRRIIPRGSNQNRNTNSNSDSSAASATMDARPPNVLNLLRDREVFGGGSGNCGIRRTTIQSKNSGGSGFRTGVCIATAESEDDGATERQRRRRRKKKKKCHRNQAAVASSSDASTKSPSISTSDTTSNDTTATASTTMNRPLNYHNHRPITDELRTYAEQVCVTKFESSYLTHLQDDVVDDQAQEATANASSKAVSTISVAFSPDGKTMASTHGDHTVKITCCLTGHLLQTLTGHPRTPWTVKYHPHAGANNMNNTMQKPVIIANSSNSSTSNTNTTTSSSNNASKEDSSGQQQPQQQQIVASGCLGHQVRIWDWISGTCLQMIRLEFAIISLSFHPSGSVLAIANGTRLHFWGLPTVTQAKDETETPSDEPTTPTNGTSSIKGGSTGGAGENDNINTNTSSRMITNPSRGMHIDMRHMLRCVHFLPDGKKVIVGGVNPQTSQEIRRQRRLAAEGHQEKIPTMSFYLRLWDFDLEATRGPPPAAPTVSLENIASGGSSSSDNNNTTQQQSLAESTRAAAAAAANNLAGITRRRRAISNPRCFVPRALLYNDGGFDVSPDGKTLCACAEYWLPEGVDNATDLLHDNDEDFYDDGDSSDDSSSDGEGESHNNNENDVNMYDVSGYGGHKNPTSPGLSPSKTDKGAADTCDSVGGVPSVDAKESNSNLSKAHATAAASHISPTRPRSNSIPRHSSATPPRTFSSPPMAAGATVGTTIFNASATQGLPIQVGLTPQTPPPNANPLNFPLSPPSPPGRRFAGGLNRGAQSSSQHQQHEQLLQQYNRQQAMLHQQRHNQQQQIIPPAQHQRGGLVSTPPNQGTGNATTIPAPPGINHRNHRQHRLHHTQQSGASGLQKAGNPFASSSRNPRDSVNTKAQRGRFVPHVVTISLDTEPYVETITEEVMLGGLVGANVITGEATRIRTLAATAHAGVTNTNTTTVTKSTYNIPGRVTPSISTRPHVLERRPRLGQLLSACPLDGAKASAVTCVKFSPCTDFCLIGYGVREPHVEEANGETNDPPAHPPYHPVTAMYKVNKGGSMKHVSTMLSGDDDVNIARFHPDSGYGFVYGTKQGRIRILGPRPWNYYNC